MEVIRECCSCRSLGSLRDVGAVAEGVDAGMSTIAIAAAAAAAVGGRSSAGEGEQETCRIGVRSLPLVLVLLVLLVLALVVLVLLVLLMFGLALAGRRSLRRSRNFRRIRSGTRMGRNENNRWDVS